MKNTLHRQRGSALIISLLILIVMTLLGLTAMGTSGLQERMAGNTRDMTLAFQAAEAALRDGERYYEDVIMSPGSAFNGDVPGLYPPEARPNLFADATWVNARVYSGTIQGVAEQPRYIIQMLGPVGDPEDDLNISGYGDSSGIGNMTAVRISARGVGGSSNTVVYLQTTYVKRI
jgi:type IV pilus assembly protein PilX